MENLRVTNRSRNTGANGLIRLSHYAAACALLVIKGVNGLHAEEPANNSFTLSPNLPFDVNVKKVRKLDEEGNIPAAQLEFDTLAWQAFIALNSQATSDGRPDKNKTIADANGPRVWDFWRTSDSIFLPDGAEPPPWEDKLIQERSYRIKAAWRMHTTSSNFEAFSGPLVDQHGNWARYEIRVDREEFDYIRQNGLYSQDGQAAFSKNNSVDLPVNSGDKHGAIELKLAWKELTDDDDASRFYVTEIDAQTSEAGPGVHHRKMKVGLVGMHISMRTESSPEWIWSTFEQIDNVRVNKNAEGKTVHPNFYNPDVPQPINVLPAANAIVTNGQLQVVTEVGTTPDTWVESLTKTPVQVQRVTVPTQAGLNPLDATLGKVAQKLNAEVQAALKNANSVFQYYELIDTQWPVHPNAPAFAGGAGSAPESIRFKTPGEMVPVFLVNTTMETYFQKGPQTAGALEQDDRLAAGSPPIDSTPVFGTESCVGCHYSSGITVGFKKNPDGTEMLSNGIPVPIFGENNHFGKTGGANFSWMLQQEPKAKKRSGGTTSGEAKQKLESAVKEGNIGTADELKAPASEK